MLILTADGLQIRLNGEKLISYGRLEWKAPRNEGIHPYYSSYIHALPCKSNWRLYTIPICRASVASKILWPLLLLLCWRFPHTE